MELAAEKLDEFERLMSVEELAQLLSVSEDTIRRYWRRNIIPTSCGRKFGDILRFDPQEIKHWLMEGELPNGFERHPAFNDLIEVTGMDKED
jgi:excisionase family DNA binding protein